MPIVTASATRSADALINYALDDKANQRGERYVMASGLGGLLVSVAKQQMRDVRKKWNKDRKGAFVHAYHVIQSFAKDELNPDDPESWMTAQNLGRALAEDRFPGRQVLVVTQRDGKSGCVHNHLVINSIETKTGKSLDSSIVMHSRLVEAHERVLEAEGFEQRADLKQAFSDATERRERGEPSGLRRADSTQRSELREFQRYILWEADNDIADEFGGSHKPEPFSVTVLRASIKQALTDPAAIDWASFREVGRRHSVHIERRGKKGRGISYGMLRLQPDGTLAEPSASDRRRCSSLGADFEIDAVEQALRRNSAAQQAQAPAAPTVAPVAQPTTAAVKDKPAQQAPSIQDRMRAALDEANEVAAAMVQPMIDRYMASKAADAELLKAKNSPASPPPIDPTPDGPSPSGTRDPLSAAVVIHEPKIAEAISEPRAAETRTEILREQSEVAPIHEAVTELNLPQAAVAPEAARKTRESADEPKISELQSAEDEAAKLRKINERNRRLGLPSVSPEQYAAHQALTPEQRKWRTKYPELSHLDEETKPRKEQHELGD